MCRSSSAHRRILTYVAVVTAGHVGDAGQTCVVAQFEGAAVFGTSIAMMSEISVEDGSRTSTTTVWPGYPKR